MQNPCDRRGNTTLTGEETKHDTLALSHCIDSYLLYGASRCSVYSTLHAVQYSTVLCTPAAQLLPQSFLHRRHRSTCLYCTCRPASQLNPGVSPLNSVFSKTWLQAARYWPQGPCDHPAHEPCDHPAHESWSCHHSSEERGCCCSVRPRRLLL